MSQAPTQHASNKKLLSMVSDDWEFRSGNDNDNEEIEDGKDEEDDNRGDKDDNEEEDSSEGDEMEEDEYSGGHRFEMVDGERSMPTILIGGADMDINESVGQEPPMADDGTTHLLNASTHVLPSSPSAIADPPLSTLPSGDDMRS